MGVEEEKEETRDETSSEASDESKQDDSKETPKRSDLDEGEEEASSSPSESNEDQIEGKERSSFLHKWVLVSFVLIVSILLGLIIKLPHLWSPYVGTHTNLYNRSENHERPLSYERLNPFFVPQKADSANLAVRLDISVRWDKTTGKRYKKNAARIRVQIYDYLLGFDKWSEDASTYLALIELEMGRILKQSLGVKNVELALEKIKFI